MSTLHEIRNEVRKVNMNMVALGRAITELTAIIKEQGKEKEIAKAPTEDQKTTTEVARLRQLHRSGKAPHS